MAGMNPVRSSHPSPIVAPPAAAKIINPVHVQCIFTEHTSMVKCLDTLSGGMFVSGSFDTVVKEWVKTSNISLKTIGQNSLVYSIATLGAHHIAVGHLGASIEIYSLENADHHPLKVNSLVVTLAASENGLLASGHADGTVKVWNPFTSECIASFKCSPNSISSVKFLNNNKTVIAGTREGAIQFCDYTSTGTSSDDKLPWQTFQRNSSYINSLAVLYDGTIALGSEDCIIRTWDSSALPENALLKELRKHGGNIPALAFRQDGLLVSGSSDRTIILWDVRDETFWQSPEEHTAQISAIATFADNTIITGSDDKTIKLWG